MAIKLLCCFMKIAMEKHCISSIRGREQQGFTSYLNTVKVENLVSNYI